MSVLWLVPPLAALLIACSLAGAPEATAAAESRVAVDSKLIVSPRIVPRGGAGP